MSAAHHIALDVVFLHDLCSFAEDQNVSANQNTTYFFNSGINMQYPPDMLIYLLTSLLVRNSLSAVKENILLFFSFF